jgi:SpoVK/Ycf46/Vps4 family AAA+-type ATPase
MGRAERRRLEKNGQKEKTATYNLTKSQLDAIVREKIGDEIAQMKKDATEEAVNTAMILLLTLPLEVLMDHYWTKSYAKKIPEFTNYVLQYYEQWQNGDLDMDELKEDLWKYGGVRLEEGE